MSEATGCQNCFKCFFYVFAGFNKFIFVFDFVTSSEVRFVVGHFQLEFLRVCRGRGGEFKWSCFFLCSGGVVVRELSRARTSGFPLGLYRNCLRAEHLEDWRLRVLQLTNS